MNKKQHILKHKQLFFNWPIQVGLLTPLTFAWLLLLLVHTFFTMEGGDSEFANFTLPTLKAFFEARIHNVPGNKQ